MAKLRLEKLHDFDLNGKKYFFDHNTLLVGKLDSVSSEVVNTLKKGEQTEKGIIQKLTSKYDRNAITEAIKELQQIAVISPDLIQPHESDAQPKGTIPMIRSITLHIANDCNLRCSYCYGNGGSYGEERCLMNQQTAKASIDFLVKCSGNRKELSIVFFGGEPLMNFPIIKTTVNYCKGIENKLDKKFIYGITTNGTMFNKENIEFMRQNKFSVLVSLDGTKEIHDRCRLFPSGRGSYDVIVKKLKKFFNMRNVSVRCTLPYDCFDLEGSVMNMNELGIGKAHFELADGHYDVEQIRKFYLPGIKKAFTNIAFQCEEWSTNNNSFILRNLIEFMRKLHFREMKICGCGAGRSFVSVSAKGNLYPCHRIVGNGEFMTGDIYQGFSDNAKERFDLKTVNQIPRCSECIAKFICAGGCPISNYTENDDINAPSEVHCELTQHIVKLALVLYIKLKNSKNLRGYLEKK